MMTGQPTARNFKSSSMEGDVGKDLKWGFGGNNVVT